jgi:iron complex transport system substrate-binding protein
MSGTVIAEDTRIVTDMAGKEVTLPGTGATYATLGGPLSQLPYLYGAGDQVVAMSAGGDSPLMLKMDPSISQKPIVRNGMTNINIEELLKTEPSAAIAFLPDGQLIQAKTKIPVIYYTGSMSDTFDDIKSQVTLFGGIFNNPEKAEKYNSYVDKTLQFIHERTADLGPDEKNQIFLGEGALHMASVGGDTFVSYCMEAAALTNAVVTIQSAQSKQEGLHSGFTEIPMENILWADPDIIMIDTGIPDDLTKDPQWKEISAVKEGKVFVRPSGLFTWSRPSIESAALFPLWMAVKAYPDKFQDVSLEDEFKQFYLEFFDLELTDTEVANIISGEYTAILPKTT